MGAELSADEMARVSLLQRSQLVQVGKIIKRNAYNSDTHLNNSLQEVFVSHPKRQTKERVRTNLIKQKRFDRCQSHEAREKKCKRN